MHAPATSTEAGSQAVQLVAVTEQPAQAASQAAHELVPASKYWFGRQGMHLLEERTAPGLQLRQYALLPWQVRQFPEHPTHFLDVEL